MDEIRLNWLVEHLSRNRFLPCPDPEAVLVGDGDFRSIGVEFLRYAIKLGGLRPDARVLDFGCGQGRVAVPLTQFLGDTGNYRGLDVAVPAVEWCRSTISPVYPTFEFTAFDTQSSLYNPNGTVPPLESHLPYADESFDFALSISVFTHLAAAEIQHYAAELARVLVPGGRLLATFFLMDAEVAELIRAGKSDYRLAFPADAETLELQGIPDVPFAAVAVNAAAVQTRFTELGFTLVGPVHAGNWSGREGKSNYQDICVFEKATG